MLQNAQTELMPPNVRILVDTIVHYNSIYAHSIKKALVIIKPHEMQDLEHYLVFCLSQGLSIAYLAESYLTIMADVLRETVYFQEHGKYRYASFDEVASSVYYDDNYMSLYMHGVFISLFFWPNHLELLRFFRKTLPKNKKGNYLEIGPGHGYFFKTAVEQTAYNNFVGIDLSETSIRQTRRLVEINKDKAIHLHCVDFLQFPLNHDYFDAIVMGEMLEHVERPQDFLKKIAAVAKEDAYIFITTCINAPLTDHIYLFKDTQQITDLFLDCGLDIKQQCILPYMGKTLQECVQGRLAINVGYVLGKQ